MNENPQTLWREHALRAYSKIKGNRSYALNPAAELALGAIACAWNEARAKTHGSFTESELVKFFESLCPLVPELLQRRPNDPEPIPQIPIDPVTNERAVNPFLTGDLESMGVCEEKFPALAKHLKRVAKSKGFTFKHAAELEDAENNRAAAQAITYTERDHAANPYRQPNRTAQGIFEKSNPPEVVEFYRREAQPVKLPWARSPKNLTELGRLTREAPEIGALALSAGQIDSAWREEQFAQAKAQEADAIASRRAAEALLAK